MKQLGLLLCLFLGASVMGQLAWEQTELEATTKQNETSVTVAFKFKNVGQAPIKIMDVKASCGCTTTALPKKEYAPGEAGELGATMTLPTEGGKRRKSITVYTDEGNEKTYVLGLTGIKPEALTLSVSNLHWFVGDKPGPQEVRITAPEGKPVQVKAVTSDRDHFSVDFKTINAGREYLVTVTPKDTANTVFAKITLQTDLPADIGARMFFNARVLAPLPVPPRQN